MITGDGCVGLGRGGDDESVGKGALRGRTGGFGGDGRRPTAALDPVRESMVEKGGGAGTGAAPG
jgi:hypothetical protein